MISVTSGCFSAHNYALLMTSPGQVTVSKLEPMHTEPSDLKHLVIPNERSFL